MRAPTRRWTALPLAAAAVVLLGSCQASAPHRTGATPSAGVSTAFDLAYASVSYQQRLDLHLPAPSARPAPVVVWIHGGGWHTGDKNSVISGFDPSANPPKAGKCNEVVQ